MRLCYYFIHTYTYFTLPLQVLKYLNTSVATRATLHWFPLPQAPGWRAVISYYYIKAYSNKKFSLIQRINTACVVSSPTPGIETGTPAWKSRTLSITLRSRWLGRSITLGKSGRWIDRLVLSPHIYGVYIRISSKETLTL